VISTLSTQCVRATFGQVWINVDTPYLTIKLENAEDSHGKKILMEGNRLVYRLETYSVGRYM